LHAPVYREAFNNVKVANLHGVYSLYILKDIVWRSFKMFVFEEQNNNLFLEVDISLKYRVGQ
jgi:hypothetical protein